MGLLGDTMPPVQVKRYLGTLNVITCDIESDPIKY